MSEALSGYIKPFCVSNGGYKEVYIYKLDDRATKTRTGNNLTAITLKDGKKAVRYMLQENLSSVTETRENVRENMNGQFNQEANLILNSKTQATIDEIAKLGNCLIGVIIVYTTGLVRHFGYENGMLVESVADESGVAYTDRNGYDISATVIEPETAPYMTLELAQSLLVPAS
jgi:hypothetical protein